MNIGYKRISLLFWLTFFAISTTQAQLELKLQLMPDAESWGVYVKTPATLPITLSTITGSGQVTIIMPIDFEYEDLTSVHGNWIDNAVVYGPIENPGAKYVSFGLVDDDPHIDYFSGEETLLFTIKKVDEYPEFLYLIDCVSPNETDPFCFPNSMQSNPGNDLAVIDLGNLGSFPFYSGNYAPNAWDWNDSDGDGIPNAHEDTNGNGVFDPGVDISDLFDPNDPNGDGGLKLSLQLMPDGISWGVYARPAGGVSPTEHTVTHEGHTEIVAPLDFEIDSVVSHAGTWVHDTYVNGPQENETRAYLGFTLVNDNPPIIYQAFEPTLLFTIHRNGDCPDQLNIIDEDTDPVALACSPTPGDLCILNILNATDNGTTPINEYYYTGNYATSAWSCHDNDGDGILNAFEDTDGNGEFTPDSDETDLNDACDPFHPESAVLTYSGTNVVCAGETENAFLMVDVEGPMSIYKIEFTNGAEIFTVNDYQIGDQIPVVISGLETFSLVSVSDANGCFVGADELDGEIAIAQTGPLAFTQQPVDATGCSGDLVTFFGQIENQGSGTVIYQWQMSCNGGTTWSNVSDGGVSEISGAATQHLAVNNLNPTLSGCQFRLRANTSNCQAVSSETASIRAEGPFVIEQQPADLQVCSGDPACFTISASNLGEGNMAYQWQGQAPNSDTWNNMVNNSISNGATTSELCLTETNGLEGLKVRVVLKSEACEELISSTASLEVDGPLTIQTVPVDISIESFEDAVFNVEMFNEGQGTIQYQWQESSDGTTWTDLTDGSIGSTTIAGTNSPSLVISPAEGYDGKQFRVLGWTESCPQIFTPSANLTVNGSQLSIIEDLPAGNVESCGDELVILVVEYANSQGILADMQWEASADGQNWTPIQVGGFFNTGNQVNVEGDGFYAILTINAISAFNGWQYRCRLSTPTGQELYSSSTTLNVYGPLNFIVQPESATVCFNEGHTFTGFVSNPTVFPVSQYWMISDDQGATWQAIEENSPTGFGGVFQNTTSSDLTITSVEGLDGMLFRLIVGNDVCTAVSEPVHLTVETAPHCYPNTNYVDYKLKLRPDGQSWGVWVKAVGDFAATGYNIATNGRFSIAASSSFFHNNLQSHAGGKWIASKYLLSTPESPGMSYFTFELEADESVLNIQQGNEIMLFSFRTQTICPDEIYLVHDFVPTGILPNEFIGVDLGTSTDQVFFLGDVYAKHEADCNDPQNLIGNHGTNNNGMNFMRSANNKMTVFPNPATEFIEIQLPEMEEMGAMSHSILSASGAVLKTIAGQPYQQHISLEDLPKGLYFITLEVDGKIMEAKKFIKN